MTEVVINACHGGFSLSARARKAISDRKGLPCYFFRCAGLTDAAKRISDEEAFADKSLFGVFAYRVESADQIPDQSNWHEMTMEERQASNKAYEAISVPDRDIGRDDSDLVAVVRDLGGAANGRCASLRIVEVPDDVQWTIEEYDGMEWVAEVHRTWS